MAPCNKRLSICLLLLLAPFMAGCVNSPFGPVINFSLYNRGGVVEATEGNSESLIETTGGGEVVIPSKP